MNQEHVADPTVVKRQLINVLHHNRCQYDPQWFGKGHSIQVVERLYYSDGTSEKRVTLTENPVVVYHVTEGENRLKRPHTFVQLDKCTEYESPYEHMDRHAAELTGQMAFFHETKGPGQNQRRRAIHKNYDLHGTDVNLTDHYIGRYLDFYKDQLDPKHGLECAFADCEVDGVDFDGFPDPHLPGGPPCPINLMAYMHRPTRHLTVRISRESVRPNPQIAQFEADQAMRHVWMLGEVNRAPLEKAGLIYPSEIGADDPVPGPAEVAKMPLGDKVPTGLEIAELMRDKTVFKHARVHKISLLFFDSEAELLLDFLHHVNEVDRPDALMWWHADFDYNTLTGRLAANGIDPNEALCAKDFKPRISAFYDRDQFNSAKPMDDGSTMTVHGYTVWLDQQLIYASLRKQEPKKASYSLDFTIESELKEHKLRYEGSIRDFAYRDFANFVLYNALDVAPMATLEDKTGDIDLVYRLSLMTRTRMTKVMKKTVCLRNFAWRFFMDRGLVLSNNHNRGNPRDGKQFRGAFVALPALMRPVGIMIGGQPSTHVHDDVIDFDASSMYPSIMITYNIDADGQLGRIVIPFAGPEGDDKDYEEIMEILTCGDPVEIGRMALGFPGLDELVSGVLETA